MFDINYGKFIKKFDINADTAVCEKNISEGLSSQLVIGRVWYKYIPLCGKFNTNYLILNYVRCAKCFPVVLLSHRAGEIY